MYQFKIIKAQEGGYKFELEGIKLLVDDYTLVNDRHLIKTPNKAVAFFNIGDDVYGISNEPLNADNAEALYDAIVQQYNIFQTKRQDTKKDNRHAKGHTDSHSFKRSA